MMLFSFVFFVMMDDDVQLFTTYSEYMLFCAALSRAFRDNITVYRYSFYALLLGALFVPERSVCSSFSPLSSYSRTIRLKNCSF
jgi:hypothetical protein